MPCNNPLRRYSRHKIKQSRREFERETAGERRGRWRETLESTFERDVIFGESVLRDTVSIEKEREVVSREIVSRDKVVSRENEREKPFAFESVCVVFVCA